MKAPITLGSEIRRLRLEAGYSLREFATMLEISAPHQSDIELSRRMPSDPLLQLTARRLAHVGASYDALRELDVRLGADLEEWVSNTPEAWQLLREAKDSGRPAKDILRDLRSMLRETRDDQ